VTEQVVQAERRGGRTSSSGLVRQAVSWLFYGLFRLNLHFDLVLCKRWRWRQQLLVGDVRTLEIGPGVGSWTCELLRRGNRVTCVDVNARMLHRLARLLAMLPFPRERVEFVTAHALGFEAQGAYDQIVLFEVLEHLKNDAAVVHRLAACLNCGGRMLVSSPNRDCPTALREPLSPVENGGHMRPGYTPAELRALVEQAGLRVIFQDSTAGAFTQRLNSFVYFLANRLHIGRWPLIPLNLMLKPWMALDRCARHYPNMVNCIVAEKS
jgi:2-polyprenyl-3-methyl-5-hydroxy-6-metoxy-1,4-benzoquinol methylase